ncbi:DUF5683 domain-containing protein [Rufibacter glacialis]|uniref:DUF5683 domain-containing protein n=1 Tax=Rufibacter glacialis TaxID=1259555 RepID=A0A5M8QHC1_9BACT|nr:DUF5683 domain-containing protein [Rufibacter glacialis]KAA6434551.1 hypothetical protein FOE74_10205 [Rufibacter glacialis]GGK70583.1 hypothetical protein GCM10011405_18310 [Rufibacter glacialis]
MRQFAALFLFVGFSFCSSTGTAQVVTAGPDSVVVSGAKAQTDTLELPKPKNVKEAIGRWSKPAQAAFYSAVVPGLGQAYNKSYWKIPLVYATGAVIGYFIYDNNRKYQDYASALRIRLDGNPNTIDPYSNTYGFAEGLANNQGTINLRRFRDFHRKYRDLDIILGVLAWGLNIMEAHVDAHLRAFDVSEDLSLELKPNLQPLRGTPSYSAGLSLQLNLK